MSAVKFGADTSALSGMMNFQGTIDGMQSALKEANTKLNEAQSNMKAGDPTSVVNAQIAMASFSQVLTSCPPTRRVTRCSLCSMSNHLAW